MIAPAFIHMREVQDAHRPSIRDHQAQTGSATTGACGLNSTGLHVEWAELRRETPDLRSEAMAKDAER